jgi:hypothetical protein
MSESLGSIFCRAATILAVLVALFAVFNFWLIGLDCRYLARARQAERIQHNTKQA